MEEKEVGRWTEKNRSRQMEREKMQVKEEDRCKDKDVKKTDRGRHRCRRVEGDKWREGGIQVKSKMDHPRFCFEHQQ